MDLDDPEGAEEYRGCYYNEKLPYADRIQGGRIRCPKYFGVFLLSPLFNRRSLSVCKVDSTGG